MIEMFCVVVWLFPIIISIFYVVDKIQGLVRFESRYDSLSFYIICSIVVLFPSILYLVAFNPGISSYDTWQCLLVYAHKPNILFFILLECI